MSMIPRESAFVVAIKLSNEECLLLMEYLIPTVKSTSSLKEEQIQGVQRRMEEVHSSKMKTILDEQVFRKIEESLAALHDVGFPLPLGSSNRSP